MVLVEGVDPVGVPNLAHEKDEETDQSGQDGEGDGAKHDCVLLEGVGVTSGFVVMPHGVVVVVGESVISLV